MKEAMRITTAVSSRLPLVSPDEAISHNGWVIPAGVSFLSYSQNTSALLAMSCSQTRCTGINSR